MGHAAMKYMAEQKSGVIINIGSITGAEASCGDVAYATAKSGVMNGLTKCSGVGGAHPTGYGAAVFLPDRC